MKAHEETNGKNSTSFILSAFSAGIDLVTNLPWKTIFLIGLAASASIAGAQSDHDFSKENIISTICNDNKFEVWNSVPDGYVGYKGQRMFKNCKTNPKSKKCAEDKETAQKLKYSNPNEGKIRQANADTQQKMSTWISNTDPEINEILGTLSENDAILFERMINDISEIYHRYLDSGNGLKGGFCGNHSNKVTRRFLNANVKLNLEIKFQVVELSDQAAMRFDTGSYVDMEMKNHAFVLVDSQMEDVSISGDKEKVKQLLTEMDGTLCDTHQHRSGEIKKDDSGLYTAEAGWDSLKIKTMSLDLSPITKLPETAKNYICAMLSSIKLPIKTATTCEFFSSSEKANVEKRATEDSARKLSSMEII